MQIPPAPPSLPSPAVSVLLAVYNGAQHLEESLRSIMTQSLREIEIVVVDDCSTDSTPEILARLAAEDPRIRVLRAPQNLKLAGALNLGLENVRAPLVARMDHDDISLPERLAVQKRFLDAHPAVTLLATSLEWMDGDGRTYRRSVRSRDSAALSWQLRFGMHLAHPTFMFRPWMPDGTPLRYDPAFQVTEDYELVNRLILAGAGVACIPDVLLRYRFHAGSVSRQRAKLQREEARRLALGFQARALPPELEARLAPLQHCFFDVLKPGSPGWASDWASGFAAARSMLAYDVRRDPARAGWYRRQTAHLMVQCMQRSGLPRAAMARLFLRHGRDMLPGIALRTLEAKRLLPGFLRSDPDVWAAPPADPARASPAG